MKTSLEKHVEKLEELLRVADNTIGDFEALLDEYKESGSVSFLRREACEESVTEYKKTKDTF